MSRTGIDIAWDRPSIAQIKATGATWVARYFSPDPTKNLTAAEVRDYTAAGLDVVTVWEGSATRALDGRAAGVADAHAAEQQRIAVGLPADHVHHFAVDTDTTWSAVAPYFDGVMSVIGEARTGTYGGLRVVQGAHAAGIRYLWQTVAWSGGVWAPYATIRQPIGTTLGGQADYDTAEVVDFGQYPRPNPQPAPTPATPQEDDMAFEKTVAAGFGADAKGAITDASKGTVVALPPRNGTYWGAVYVSFGCDFADVTLRVAIQDAKNTWRVQTLPVKSAGPRVNVTVLDGDQKLSVLRMKTSATDTSGDAPVSCLVEAFRK